MSTWQNGSANPFCHHHYGRWKVAGRPDLTTWQADLAAKATARQVPAINLGRLARQLRLEVQYGLQCRHDEANKRTVAGPVTIAIKRLADSGVVSILDFDEDGWRTFFGTNRRVYDGKRVYASVSLKFVDTRIRLQRLLIAADPWADQYPATPGTCDCSASPRPGCATCGSAASRSPGCGSWPVAGAGGGWPADWPWTPCTAT